MVKGVQLSQGRGGVLDGSSLDQPLVCPAIGLDQFPEVADFRLVNAVENPRGEKPGILATAASSLAPSFRLRRGVEEAKERTEPLNEGAALATAQQVRSL